MTKFQNTYCSQCGGEFGPGDAGYSRCSDHRAWTPGPWRTKPWGDGSSPSGCTNVISDAAECVVVMNILEDDARLIAAAPEMYTVLQMMTNAPDNMLEWMGLVKRAQEVLAKADGKQ